MDLDQLSQALGRNLKHWRAERGLTLDALAERSAVSCGMIIQIEQARTNPSVGTTVKLADALGVGVGVATLLDFERAAPVRIVPPDQVVRMWSTPAGSHAGLLVGSGTDGPHELWTWTLMPGDESAAGLHPPATTELLHVTGGELTLLVDGTPHTVPAGSSAAFEANVRHTYRNDGREKVEMVMAVSIPSAR